MGIIAGVLITSGYVTTFDLPMRVIQPAHTASGGFCAKSAAAACLFRLAMNGIPVSTTPTIMGAIIGVGTTRRLAAVRRGVTQNIVWVRLMTVAAAAPIAAMLYELLS